MPGDLELLAARLTGAQLAVAIAARGLAANGDRVTVEQIMAHTHLSRSTVYDARARLKELWPAEYAVENGAPPVEDGTTSVEVVPAAATPTRLPSLRSGPAAPVLDASALALAPQRPTAAAWRPVVTRLALAVQGRRSWSFYEDVYGPAWELVAEAIPEDDDPDGNRLIGEQIALSCHYLETVSGDPLTANDRKMIAMLIRQYGKAGLYGLTKAVGVTNEHTPKDWFKYARQVAANVVDELRQTRQGAP